MDQAEAFRRCLETLDIADARRLWAIVFPQFPQDASDNDILISLHRARTEAASVSLKHRAYSHRWLLDNGYSSGLPDNLKPKAERLYPKIAKGVGISVNTRSEYLKPAMLLVRQAMENAVLEADADGKLDDTAFVKERMNEARNAAKKQIGLKLSSA